MRVLLISIWKPNRGGIVTHVENLIKNSGNEFTVLTYGRYIDLPVLRALSFLIFGFFKGLRADCDVIHAHYALPQGFLGVLLKKVKKKPLVLTVHGSDVTILSKNPFIRSLLISVLKGSDRIITVSEFLRQEVLKLGIEAAKVKVIYAGVSIKASTMQPSPEMGTVTFIGSLVRQKGVDILIKAFREVKERIPGAKLLIVGGGRERKRLESLAKGINDIYLLGHKEDLTDIFQKSEVLVLPSREEGFGLVILEAMSAGVPVVGTNVGGIAEIIQDGLSGVLVDREDPFALANGISLVLRDENLRINLIQNGKERAKIFSWEKMRNEVDRVYEEVTRA